MAKRIHPPRFTNPPKEWMEIPHLHKIRRVTLDEAALDYNLDENKLFKTDKEILQKRRNKLKTNKMSFFGKL